MRTRAIAVAGAAVLALLVAPKTAYALAEPGVILGVILAAAVLAAVVPAAWLGISAGVEAFVYRRVLAWPLKQAFFHAFLANMAGAAGGTVVWGLVGAIWGSVGESLMSRNPQLAMALSWLVVALGMTAVEVGVLVALNRQFAPRRRLVAVGAGVNVLTIGLPLVLMARVVPATEPPQGPGSPASTESQRSLPILLIGGIGNSTTKPFRADESWYVEWMRAGGTNTSQPLDITLVRDNVLFSRPVRKLRTIHFVPGQEKSRTESVHETGWFRLKVKASGGWQVTVYRADPPPSVPQSIQGDRQ